MSLFESKLRRCSPEQLPRVQAGGETTGTRQEHTYESHDSRYIDEEFLLERLWIILRKDLYRFGSGSFDNGRLTEEADRLVIMHLEHLVRIVFDSDGTGGFVDTKCMHRIFHESNTPLDEPEHGQLVRATRGESSILTPASYRMSRSVR